MKKLLTLAMLLVMSLSTYAQKDVTKFLGIPVDGTKSEMIRKLKAKGFTSNIYRDDILDGYFNDYSVNVHIATNGNKVWRIMVADAIPISKKEIVLRYNRLLEQFNNKSNYTNIFGNGEIIEIESPEARSLFDVFFKDDKFTEYFVQEDEETVINKIRPFLISKYSADELTNYFNNLNTPNGLNIAFDVAIQKLEYAKTANTAVWFTISEYNDNKYQILMYYDNKHNQSNGEDL